MKKVLILVAATILATSCIHKPKIIDDYRPHKGSSFGVMTYFNNGIYNQHYEMESRLDIIRLWLGFTTNSNSVWQKKYQSTAIAVDWSVNEFARSVAREFLRDKKFSYVDLNYDEKILLNNPEISLARLIANSERSWQTTPDFLLIIVQKPTTLPNGFLFKSGEASLAKQHQLLDSSLKMKQRLLPLSQTRLINFQNQFGFSLTTLTKPMVLGNSRKADFFCSSSFDVFLFNHQKKKIIAFVPAYDSTKLHELPLSYEQYLQKSFSRFIGEEEDAIHDGCLRGLVKGMMGSLKKIL